MSSSNYLKLTPDEAPQFPSPRPPPKSARSNSEPITSSPLADPKLTRTATAPSRKRGHSRGSSDVRPHNERSPSPAPVPASSTTDEDVPQVDASTLTHAKSGDIAASSQTEPASEEIEQINPHYCSSSAAEVGPSTQTASSTPTTPPVQPTTPQQYPRFEPDIIPENPFSDPLPTKTVPQHRQPLRPDQFYALYTLAPLHKGSMVELLNHIAINGGSEDSTSNVTTVVPAPVRHDFSGGHTMREVFECHVELLELSWRHRYDELHFAHDVSGKRFVVVASEDWEGNGVLIVEFDCDGEGGLGILRVRADQVIKTCVDFEKGGAALAWQDMKEVEMFEPWKESIPGYSGSEWESYGAEKGR